MDRQSHQSRIAGYKSAAKQAEMRAAAARAARRVKETAHWEAQTEKWISRIAELTKGEPPPGR